LNRAAICPSATSLTSTIGNLNGAIAGIFPKRICSSNVIEENDVFKMGGPMIKAGFNMTTSVSV